MSPACLFSKNSLYWEITNVFHASFSLLNFSPWRLNFSGWTTNGQSGFFNSHALRQPRLFQSLYWSFSLFRDIYSFLCICCPIDKKRQFHCRVDNIEHVVDVVLVMDMLFVDLKKFPRLVLCKATVFLFVSPGHPKSLVFWVFATAKLIGEIDVRILERGVFFSIVEVGNDPITITPLELATVLEPLKAGILCGPPPSAQFLSFNRKLFCLFLNIISIKVSVCICPRELQIVLQCDPHARQCTF